MNELKRKYYQTELIRIHRGNSRGVFINAKPLYVISLIECIDKGILLENKIEYPAPEIAKVYLETCEKYEPGRKLSPFILPYFHISTESFYDIQWKGTKFVPSRHAHSPSGKYLKENVSYAYLDEALWDLLQEPNVREQYRELIVNFFLRPKTEE